MIKGKKVIGVCLTKIHDTTRSNYIMHLHEAAKKQGYKLLVFNSFVDFYHNDAFDEGAKRVYDIINYNILDAIIVHCESFYNKSIVENIVAGAKQNHTPVVLINEEKEGCYSVVGECAEAYKSVLQHIIQVHGVRDTYYLAGNRENDENSRFRINCYREVLEENGLCFDENKVGYGGYWDEPARKVIEALLESGDKLPEAIFCANDNMAFAVCELLNENGYRVPEDVIVTGFDGVPLSRYCTPQLTTCAENMEGMAKLSIQAVQLAVEGKQGECVLRNSYIPVISESCGCKIHTQEEFRRDSEYLFHSLNDMEVHEENAYTWIDRMLSIKDMNSLYKNLSGCILGDSYVCLNNDFVASAMKENVDELDNRLSQELVVISSMYSKKDSDKTGTLHLEDMVPDVEEWVEDDKLCILTAVYAGDEVCGYYAAKVDSIMKCRHKIKRVSKTINVACNVAINHFRQVKLRQSVESASMTNPITGLPNLKGTVKWFEEFASLEKNHKKALSISVYGLPKYTYIYENYGIKDVEEVLRFVAESLKIANPTDCFIGHISEDEFTVINYYDSKEQVSDTIISATSVFFSVVEGYNSNSEKEYFIEVNCGCTEVYSDWQGSLEGFIKFANSEMYMNRLKMGAGAAVKEQIAPKEHYKALELLIEKNLFQYHFQPIVNAKNGEIYAYEALMRTDASIGMNPLEVLEAAKEYNCLYEIEHATMFNIMERYAKERDKFGERKVFINTIPGYFLKAEDISKLTDKYGKYMHNVVFELTEQNTVSDEELNSIRKLSGVNETGQIAIDDYGTGHSNIVNLMRYAPHIIKIDRFLISDIHKNQNKQMFVRSTIEFAKMNNIMVLAEGVETSNELRMVIDLGVDLIQGYYTGRPIAEPIAEIAKDIKKEILDANPLFGKRA